VVFGPSGSILLPDDDEITRKLAMLFEGQCEGLGPTQAARRFGYTKQRYFQLLEDFQAHGALALQSKARGPKTNYRRTWDLLCAWSQSSGQTLWPSLALHLVHEAALCVHGLRTQRSLTQKGFELANGLPFCPDRLCHS
jgi:hypothetical protein